MTHTELKNAWLTLVTAETPTEAFWALWREQKDTLKRLGVVVTKNEDGSYSAALLDAPVAPKVAAAKLLTLKNVPTLADFGQMTVEEKVAWVKANEKTAKSLGINLVKHEAIEKWNIPARETVELAGISELGLKQSVCWWSAKQAGYAASELKRLGKMPVMVNNRNTEQQMLALWEAWQKLPLNELKFVLVNEAKKGLQKYFSVAEVSARAARADHAAMMQHDPSYAFDFLRSKARGEYDALPEGASDKDIEEARQNSENEHDLA